jgi:Chitobiase/beta-hexosaminidase C-terminal domain
MARTTLMHPAAIHQSSQKIGGVWSIVLGTALAIAGLLPQVQAQQFQIRSVSPSFIGAGANGATLALSGTLPDFTQGAYQVCFYTGFGSSAAITPTLVKGVATLAVAASSIQGLPAANFTAANNFSVTGSITVVPQGTVCSGAFDPTLTNSYSEPISEPLLGPYSGPLNIPQTNSATNVQAAPVNVVLSGASFTTATTVKLGSFDNVTAKLLSPSTLSFAVPAAFSSSPVGTTAAISVCNSDGYCAAGITLTVTALVPSAGSLTVTPTPVTTAGTTTLTAQFKRDPANGTTLPEPGAPSGSVTFTAAGNSVGTASLVLDPTAVFVPVVSTTQVAAVAAPVISPAAGTYQTAQTITISDATPGTSILYTLDGSTPTATSTLYTGPILVSTAATVGAIAVAAGSRNSSPVSQAYVIFVPTSTSVAFVQQPTTSATNTVIAPPITVQILDQKGNPITSSTALVTMALGANPGSGTLSGTTSVNAVNGIATFADLSIDAIANAYTLTASSAGLTSAASTAFNITPYPITVKLFDPLIGVSSTLPGTFTLSHPAPSPNGIVVSLASSATGNVTVSPANVNVPAGGTTGSFTYTGVAPGPATITASASNYLAGSGTVTATNSLVSLGTIPAVSPGQSVSLALSLATNAPAGGVTVNFTSSNPAVATITASVFIPQGQRTAATNPQITGVTIGTTTITATAQNYAPDTRTVNVSVTATFKPTSASVNLATTSATTLNISAPAQAGGLTFTLSSDDSTKVSVASSITIPQGQTSVGVPITGVLDGSSTTIRADSPGVTEATLSVTVSSKVVVPATSTGVNMENPAAIFVPVASPTPVTVTITSSDPTVATVSLSATVIGTPSIVFNNVTAAGYLPNIYVQGQKVGTATLTVTAPGYTTGTATITVGPSGFSFAGFFNSGLSTTSFSSPTSVTVYPTILNASGNLVTNNVQVNPGLGTVSVAVTSSDTSIGTIVTNPVVFNSGDGGKATNFQPSSAGTTTIAIGATPAGFSTSAQYTQFVATVTAPLLSISGVTTGVNLETPTNVSLPVAPPSARAVTVTSSDPTIAAVSLTSTTVGTPSITYNNVTAAGFLPAFYVQGLKVGTTTLTVSAPGYANGTATVTVGPSGFSFAGFFNNGLSTTSFSTATSITVYPTVLTATGNLVTNNVYLSPGLGSVSIAVNSSDTSIGTITSSPVVFNAGDNGKSTTFQPSSAGTTTIAVGAEPAGFSTPAQYTQFVATVTAPQLSISSVATGVSLEAPTNVSLPVAPPSARAVTVTSNDPTVATVAMNSTTVGTPSITYNNITAAGFIPALYVQGQKVGTTTMTVSAPGYASATVTITVYPSGFSFAGFNNNGLATTTFSTATGITVYPSLLNPGPLTFYSNNVLVSPGLGPISIAVTSSNTNVGTITTSPVVFNGGDGGKATTFQPSSAGSTVIAVGSQPASFSTPSQYTQFTTTVTAPQLSIGTAITGLNMESTTNISVPVAPPNPVTVTVTSDGPAIATVSKSGTVVGGTTLTFTNVTSGGNLPAIYVQGQSIGSTTLTVSAPGYSNGTAVITVNPSGFSFAGFNNNGLNTTAAATPTTLQVFPSILNPGILTFYSNNVYVNPGQAPISVSVTSSNTNTGTIATSPVVFHGGDQYQITTFKPNATGTSTITIVPPAGYSTPTQYQQINATVQ